METYFGADARRIEHAHRVTDYAKSLLAKEGGNKTVVIAAALLHDIGIHEAERKYASTSGYYQEIEGPPIARQIMSGLNFTREQVEEVCDIIAHHHSPGKIKTCNFRILYDADWLVNLKDEYDVRDKTRLGGVINKLFLTDAGKKLARQIYLSEL
ncbi:MAG: hypothetical protein A2Z15_08455 [Chloroflexi bacterium RBG_16_50_11]|nr:MAG: hypothetical protein A2Z15_08455 [Chloroflexi bacterium RBG_16_50_11]